MNEKLYPQDEVELLSTDDRQGVPVGTKGIVTTANEVQGLMIYGMKWENGSKLNLVEGIDGKGDFWKKLN